MTHITDALNLRQQCFLSPHLIIFIPSPPQDSEKDVYVITTILAASYALTVKHQVKTLYGRDWRRWHQGTLYCGKPVHMPVKHPFRTKASTTKRSATTALTSGCTQNLQPRSFSLSSSPFSTSVYGNLFLFLPTFTLDF